MSHDRDLEGIIRSMQHDERTTRGDEQNFYHYFLEFLGKKDYNALETARYYYQRLQWGQRDRAAEYIARLEVYGLAID